MQIGSRIRVGWFRVYGNPGPPTNRQVGEEYVLTIRDPSSVGAMAIGVSYDAFVDDVEVRAQLAGAMGRSLRSLLLQQL